MTPETYRYCRYEADGPLLTLTIDRPEVLNAMHPDAHREFADAFDRYAADPSLRVAIVTGAGERAFCVGTDLKAFDATGDHTKPATGFAGITHRFTLWKPLIAAVNGLCLGGGMGGFSRHAILASRPITRSSGCRNRVSDSPR
jgi:crotonobetainyl-CoA hydratase